jgi:hypothetical protein
MNFIGKFSWKLLAAALSGMVLAILLWTLLFYRNSILSEVLPDIHRIFISTLLSFVLIKLLVPPAWTDMLKIFIRTMFRVWLLIFITFAVKQSMERVGFILSITFIFGYFEALLDIDRWQDTHRQKRFLKWFTTRGNGHYNHAITTVILMTGVHCLCGILVWLFYLFY